jgi:hypothetical protein
MASVGPLEVGPVEVGEHVTGPGVESPAELGDLDEGGGDPIGETVDESSKRLTALGGIGGAVGGDHLLVDAPGDLHGGVGLVGEEGVEAGALLVGAGRRR